VGDRDPGDHLSSVGCVWLYILNRGDVTYSRVREDSKLLFSPSVVSWPLVRYTFGFDIL
jgi:hypothetical protein